eukprot:gnl/TRDRNA2_/TRDRNA2_185498_c0_seq1.p1 gnl/TRDRNA2_/TRDRNA2_185498_c0~~gnl/TRDRNA2_/TRDRNA2_185498_c0_seq1.p1  ORF type:complete len:246 (+),score=62.19 gnl/TRDRNA2_/TRDRNA2_185498_c0_seq1:99-836(+)
MQASGAAARSGASAGRLGEDGELLSLVTDELVAEYKERLHNDARQACEQIDRLLFSALRQLPPNIRAMPVREAFRLACDEEQDVGGGSVVQPVIGAGGLCSGGGVTGSSSDKKKRHDAHTQTNLYSVKTKRLKAPPSGGSTGNTTVSPAPGANAGTATVSPAPGSMTPLCASLSGMNIVSSSPQGPAEVPMASRKQELMHQMEASEEFITEAANEKFEKRPSEQRRMFMDRASHTYDKMFAQGGS